VTAENTQAILISLQVGFWVVLLGFPIALFMGWLLARRQFFGSTAIGTLVLVPMVLPPVVTGLLILDLLGRNTTLGGICAKYAFPLSFSFQAAVLAALVVGLPLYIWAARSAFEAVDRRYEELSLSMGVPPWQTFFRVTLPLASPGLAAGMVLAFARGLGEFGATAVLAGNKEGETRTIALAVYTLLESPHGEEATYPLVLASLGLSIFALVGYERLLRWQRHRLELDNG
jgi:molybdate transport system permease protein